MLKQTRAGIEERDFVEVCGEAVLNAGQHGFFQGIVNHRRYQCARAFRVIGSLGFASQEQSIRAVLEDLYIASLLLNRTDDPTFDFPLDVKAEHLATHTFSRGL
ncbi:MAG: hypothetical protein V2A71_00620 [Candidatus Eisenbacteria bacterium]